MTTVSVNTSESIAALGLVPPIGGDAIVQNTERLKPLVEREADEIERIGHLTATMKDALAAAGCFRLGFARRVGGPELSFRDQVKVVETLSRVDGSVGWNAKILSDSGFYASRLDAGAFTELYPSLDYATAGSFGPPGRAQRVDGGYVVTGRWNFGSGINSADQILGGVHVFDGDDKVMDAHGPLVLGVYLPVKEVVIEDNWHVTGMRGSGSNSYSVHEVFVPETHCFVRSAEPNVEADPLNKHVELPFFNAVGLTLGIAQHAVDIMNARITSGPAPMSDRDGIQRLYGEAISYVDGIRSHAYRIATELDEVIFSPGGLIDSQLFSRMIAASPLTGRFGRHVIDLAVEVVGSSSIYVENPLERVVRDMHTNLVHIQNAQRRWVDSAVWALKGHAPGR